MQIVGYETAPGTLLLADGGSVRRVSLDATRRLSYALCERRCAGALDDGTHVGCDRESVPREVREGTADLDPAPNPDRQASLGSFG